MPAENIRFTGSGLGRREHVQSRTPTVIAETCHPQGGSELETCHVAVGLQSRRRFGQDSKNSRIVNLIFSSLFLPTLEGYSIVITAKNSREASLA